jgi:hypothetical protein
VDHHLGLLAATLVEQLHVLHKLLATRLLSPGDFGRTTLGPVVAGAGGLLGGARSEVVRGLNAGASLADEEVGLGGQGAVEQGRRRVFSWKLS